MIVYVLKVSIGGEYRLHTRAPLNPHRRSLGCAKSSGGCTNQLCINTIRSAQPNHQVAHATTHTRAVGTNFPSGGKRRSCVQLTHKRFSHRSCNQDSSALHEDSALNPSHPACSTMYSHPFLPVAGFPVLPGERRPRGKVRTCIRAVRTTPTQWHAGKRI